MAAHCLRALNELADGKCTVAQFRHALSFAQLGDNLETDDWQILKEEPDDLKAVMVAKLLVGVYKELHSILGEPETAEEWNRLRWNAVDNEKYTRKHKELSSQALRLYFAVSTDVRDMRHLRFRDSQEMEEN